MYNKIRKLPKNIRFWFMRRYYWYVENRPSNGIKNLIYWFKIIWKDRWYDHNFLLRILRHKLIQMEKGFREDGVHVDADQDAKKIKKCVLLLDRLLNDDYHDIVFENHYRKWGEPEFSFKPIDDKYYEMVAEYENVKTEEDKKQQEKEYRLLIYKPEELRKQDSDMLFKLMAKHIRTWWD